MKKSLVIVESPTKAKTMTRFLDSSYKVVSSMGHMIDLPKNKLGINIEEGFIPQYKVLKGREKLVSQIKKDAKSVDTIYLATDPDREGEAISWHIKNVLDKKKKKEFFRVVFHEITKKAINEAFLKPHSLNQDKVNAQQARRLLDRIVGYFLSPFLWKRICRGLSAGRVQSVALKFIVDREREISLFVPRKYYIIDAWFQKGEHKFKARLIKKDQKKISLEDKETAENIKALLKDKDFLVKDVKRRVSLRKPYPPFITSSLQQESFRNYRYSTSKTMLLAQRLYEGIEVPDVGMVGLITYMRTDSFQVSESAQQEAKQFITEKFGQKYLYDKPYKFKAKGIVQGAHEAIRPTSVDRVPEDLLQSLPRDEFSLYILIWKRFMACYMKEAEIANTQVILEFDDYQFVATGSEIVFDGFLKVYPEKIKEESLPALEKQQAIRCIDVKAEEKSTNPPPRFNDASLVRLLEQKGVGRPSTYAPTISTLIFRNYVQREKGSFIPTDLGIAVIELLMKFFTDILNENFTAEMEKSLDSVEQGNLQWKKILSDFYPQFKKNLENAEKSSVKKLESAGRLCDKCGKDMVIRYSRRGKFISCSDYPTCKQAYSITTGVGCPECKTGELIERRNRRGQKFYGCSQFPKCRHTSSTLPETGNIQGQ